MFDGSLDEIKIFNKGLTSAEIQAEMNAIRPLTGASRPPVSPATLPTGKPQQICKTNILYLNEF